MCASTTGASPSSPSSPRTARPRQRPQPFRRTRRCRAASRSDAILAGVLGQPLTSPHSLAHRAIKDDRVKEGKIDTSELDEWLTQLDGAPGPAPEDAQQ